MTYEEDRYGSHHREEMKRSMEKPANKWEPCNRRSEKDWLGISSRIVGVLAALFLIGTVIAQVWIRWGPR